MLLNSKMSLSGVRVLVTGATGFIGKHLCRQLLSQGAIVHAVSRSEHTPEEAITWWQSKLETKTEVEQLLDATRPDVIYHLAGAVSASQEIEWVQPTFTSLLQSTLFLLEAVTVKKNCRLLLTGSLNEPVGDADAIPSSPYSAAKWMSSGYARMFHHLYQTPVVILRLFMGYGPGQPANKVIPATIATYLQGKSPQLTTGSFTTDWIYIDDLVSGLLAAATAPDIEGKTIDLASGETASVKDIALLLKAILHSPLTPQFGSLPDRKEVYVRVADVAPARELLQWQAQVRLKEGLIKTANWYQQLASKNLAHSILSE
ncbi:NAD-dependent epimerase/dehydratase family protein [Pontibacter fetidus]|uniref:NAD(P)-dependent oxidoreductase n=1 Tax=Pontibacter fetidus TaxID=2700082 RepID=A0A6B2H033_9BACT|nr:NAD(P)-dependent oxidoreductase [Pontibacter fetidus]NDK55673.1 NAD(P)-dependent oxidoreductase [Pontibacter fetidus]